MRACPPVPARLAAFTLMEVLIVVGVIALLASMAMPVLGVAQRAAKKTATLSVMHKLDTAVRLFRTDVGAYPYQRTYADTSAGDIPTNRLYHHLGTKLSAAEVVNLHVDANNAAAQYDYPCQAGNGGLAEQPPVSPHVYLIADMQPTPSTNGDSPAWKFQDVGGGVWDWKPYLGGDTSRMATCVLLNRMAAERARLSVWAGNVDVTGTRIKDHYRPDGVLYMTGKDNSGSELLAAKATDAKPGWGDDYLKGELEKRFIDGETVLDAWKRPIIYVCQVTEGMRGTRGFIFHENLRWVDSDAYGLRKQGRNSLADVDPYSGAPIAADGTYLPDPTNFWDSDRRRWAPVGLEFEFELWSSGPDLRFDWMRPHPFNIDNVSMHPYDKDIQR